MKTIELDLSGCRYLDELYERIRAAFKFPEWYGKNWDAFWDLLWSECDADKVIIKGEHSLPDDLSASLYKMHEVLDDTIEFRRENNLNSFSYDIIN